MPDTPRSADVPDEAVAAFCRTFWGAQPFELLPGLVEQARTTVTAVVAAVVPEIERQVREQTLRDLDAGTITAEDLESAGLDPGHVVDLRRDGWTIQHPLTCGTDLFACPVNRAAERDLTEPPDRPGQYVCGVDDDGRFVIGELKVARGGA